MTPRSIRGAYLVITPNKTDDHSILFPPLHAVHGTDLEIETVYGPQQSRQQSDLCLISRDLPLAHDSPGTRIRPTKTHGVMMAIWLASTPTPVCVDDTAYSSD